jgi:hypothetical protein
MLDWWEGHGRTIAGVAAPLIVGVGLLLHVISQDLECISNRVEGAYGWLWLLYVLVLVAASIAVAYAGLRTSHRGSWLVLTASFVVGWLLFALWFNRVFLDPEMASCSGRR